MGWIHDLFLCSGLGRGAGKQVEKVQPRTCAVLISDVVLNIGGYLFLFGIGKMDRKSEASLWIFFSSFVSTDVFRVALEY